MVCDSLDVSCYSGVLIHVSSCKILRDATPKSMVILDGELKAGCV